VEEEEGRRGAEGGGRRGGEWRRSMRYPWKGWKRVRCARSAQTFFFISFHKLLWLIYLFRFQTNQILSRTPLFQHFESPRS
jgi:hypothetical protein